MVSMLRKPKTEEGSDHPGSMALPLLPSPVLPASERAPERGGPSMEPGGELDSRANLARRRMEAVPRDDMGFAEGGFSLTAEQLKWITLRLDSELDIDADKAAEVDEVKRRLWQKIPDFRALYDLCQSNKREAMRLLGTQMLPKALRTIAKLLDSDSPRAQAQGLNFLLRTQGLMVDKKNTTDPNELAALLVALRSAQSPQFIDASALGPPRSGVSRSLLPPISSLSSEILDTPESGKRGREPGYGDQE